MSRATDLRDIFKDFDEQKYKIIKPLIDEAVFLEKQMASLKKYPFIKTREFNGVVQTKTTAAGKQYRELLQTYTNIIDKLCRMLGKTEGEANSGLREFFGEMMRTIKDDVS